MYLNLFITTENFEVVVRMGHRRLSGLTAEAVGWESLCTPSRTAVSHTADSVLIIREGGSGIPTPSSQKIPRAGVVYPLRVKNRDTRPV